MELGAPTSYNYILPEIRTQLCCRFLKYNSPQIMLDYGCGNGASTVLFKKYFKKIIGLDVELTRITEANNYKNKNKINNISYRLYNGYHIPFKKNFFDFVTSFEVIEHVQNDDESLKEIVRVLKLGGTFCLSIPNKYYLMETHGFNLPLKHIIPYNRIPFLNLLPRCFYNKFGNARIYSEKEIINLLRNNNLNIKKIAYIKPPLDRITGIFLKNIIKFIIRFLPQKMGGSIFIICQKK